MRLLLNFDLQTPIWTRSFFFGLPIAWAVFLDVGALADAINAFDAESFKPSVGLALLRVAVPFGALSLEYGIPLIRRPGDDSTLGIPGRFHFNFGVFY